MRYTDLTITLQEIPNEISLAFSITGCPIKCSGCHSKHLWDMDNGELLSKDIFNSILKKYQNYITCVLFMGGEWYKSELITYLELVKSKNIKRALYTGQDNLSIDIKILLNYLKLGKYNRTLGGLGTKGTNQKLYNLDTNEIMNHYFI